MPDDPAPQTDVRVIIDANTLVSAALKPGGVPAQALATAITQGVIVHSRVVYDEVAEVLARPKSERVLGMQRRRDALEYLP